VSDKSVKELKDEIVTAGIPQTVNGVVKNPKPILLHINSPGGDAHAGLSCMSIFSECKVPIAVMVDGISASAATFLSIYAPYRVATPLSMSLIHEYSQWLGGKASDHEYHLKVGNEMLKFIKRMYIQHTKIKPKELKRLLKHDLYLDATTCKELGLVDRIIDPCSGRKEALAKYTAINPTLNLPAQILLKKSHMNHVSIGCTPNTKSNIVAKPWTGIKDVLIKIDKLVFSESTEVRPVVFRSFNSECSTSLNSSYFPLVCKIQALHMPTVGVIDTILTIHEVLPLLCCTKRIMYENAMVCIHVMYESSNNLIFADAVHNTHLIVGKLKAFLAAHTKLPAKILDNLEQKRFVLSPAKCLKYGLIDEIVPMLA
jgi:ATP-dependent protease ClpP protease subunit